MTSETKIHLVSEGKGLIVTCSKADFASIKQAICTQIGYTEPVTDVVDLQVSDNSRWQNTPRASGLGDKVALVGCGVIGFLMMTVFVSGIAKIAEIFSQ